MLDPGDARSGYQALSIALTEDFWIADKRSILRNREDSLLALASASVYLASVSQALQTQKIDQAWSPQF